MKRFLKSDSGTDKENVPPLSDSDSNGDRAEYNREKRIAKRQKLMVEELPSKTLNELHNTARDRMIKLEEESHTYWKKNKKMDISVTKLLSYFTGKFRPNSIIDKMFSKCDDNFRIVSKSKYNGKSKMEVLDMWNEARDFGTECHEIIEKFLLNSPRFVDRSDAMGFARLTHPDGFDEPAVDEKFMNCLKQFFTFHTDMLDQGWEPMFSERVVFTDEDKYLRLAGSIDAIYRREMVAGSFEYAIVDWKTTSKNLRAVTDWKNKICTYPLGGYQKTKFLDYSLQLSIYKYILEKYYDMEPITELLIVKLNPSGKKHSVLKAPLDIDVEKVLNTYKSDRQLADMFERFDKRDAKVHFDPDLFPSSWGPLRYETHEEYAAA